MKTNRTTYDPERPFQTIAHASRTTGLSQYFLRQACKANTIPYIHSGTTYMINMPLLQAALDELSKSSLAKKA